MPLLEGLPPALLAVPASAPAPALVEAETAAVAKEKPAESGGIGILKKGVLKRNMLVLNQHEIFFKKLLILFV